MRYLGFILTASAILAAVHVLLGWRLIVPAKLSRRARVIAWTLIVFSWLTPLLSLFLFLTRTRPAWNEYLAWIGFLSLGLFFLALSLVLLRDVLWLLITAVGKLISWWLKHEKRESETRTVDPERRLFLIRASSSSALGLAGMFAGYGFFEARCTPNIQLVTVPIDNLPPALDGFRIAQITDIHVGPTIKRQFVQTVVRAVNELRCDLIAFTGDLVDGTVPRLRNDVAPMAELEAPGGVWFVTGNHEYYSGVEPWLEEVDRLGMTALNNEHRVMTHNNASFVLAGVTDYSAGQHIPGHATDPTAAFAGAPHDIPRILMAHQPRSIYEAEKLGCDLQLSGHTHGGQIYPFHFLAGLAQPYLSGLHKHNKTWVYVSRGTGYWGPPIRIGAPSEITVITLQRDLSSS